MKDQALQAARAQRGWSQKETAVRMGVSQPYLSMLENEERRLTPRLARKVTSVLNLPPTFLPLPPPKEVAETLDPQEFAEELATLGYPGYAYLRGRHRKRNPAEVLLTALAQENLEARLVEALPWLLLKYWNADVNWLARNAKLLDLQNRLGYVVTLARQVAERFDGPNSPRVAALSALVSSLERSKLSREDTLCEASLSELARNWLRERRSAESKHWNLLTGWRAEHLSYVE